MSELCINLPPFSPDYSGAASALFELGGMIVIHDASGCTGNYLGYDEPRWMNSKSIVYCSGLRHMDAVLGNDSKLADRIAAAAKSLNPRFIALLGSPVPMIIGTDYDGIAVEIECRTGIPSFGFDTKGLAYYDRGISSAVIALLRRFAPASRSDQRIPGTVNILGLTPLDFGNNGNAEDFSQLFSRNGIAVTASFSMGLTVEHIQRAPCAWVNVAVSLAGIEIAEYMKRVYGQPYISGVPLGTGDKFVAGIKNALSDTSPVPDPVRKYAPPERPGRKHILIVGEQILADSLRAELRRRGCLSSITVAVLFNSSASLLESGDYAHICEKQLRQLVNSGTYTAVIADPLVQQLIKDTAVRFYGIPHTAVSSKVCWDETKRFVSAGMEQFLRQIAETE